MIDVYARKNIDPADLEEFIVPKDRHNEAPKEAVEIYEREIGDRVPTAIAKHPTLGWFVIQTCGQGPYVIWPETGS